MNIENRYSRSPAVESLLTPHHPKNFQVVTTANVNAIGSRLQPSEAIDLPPNPPDEIEHRSIIGMRVDATDYDDATNRILEGANEGVGKYVCAANVHMAMESHDSKQFSQIVNRAYLVTPDGMPMVLGLRALGIANATRVCGPALTLTVCKAAADRNMPIALYGGTEESLEDFTKFLKRKFPHLQIACKISPPFRPLSPAEDERYTNQLVASGAKIVFVGIGCPRQEMWMAEHQDRIPAVMLGVGAAFDFHSGRVKQAPTWMQKLCLEWLFRLMMEPRRLWKRYFKHNPRFIILFLSQLIFGAIRSSKAFLSSN